MAAPGMFALPVIMERMEKQSWFRSRPVLHAPFQVLGVGCFLLFMVPTACSIWPQTMSVTSEKLRWEQKTSHYITVIQHIIIFPGLQIQRHILS